MSDYGYPKFAWMARVAEDDRMTDTHRLILVYCALQYVKGADEVFSVRQTTVAAKLHMHVNTVANALRRGREWGWLQQVAQRERGRGGQADIHRITTAAVPTPESGYVPTPSCGLDEEVPTPGSGSTHTPSEKYPHDGVEVPTRRNAPTSEKTPPTGFIYRVNDPGLKLQGGARARGAPPERAWQVLDFDNFREPPKVCDDHPYGTKGSCIACKVARQRNELWWQEATAYFEEGEP